MAEEDLEAIIDVLCNGDIEEELYEKNFEFDTNDKEEALEYFHKVKRVYEIFNLKCPFILVETKMNDDIIYLFFDENQDELDSSYTLIER